MAGFRKCGCIFAIYKDEFNYCVHSEYEWKENEETEQECVVFVVASSNKTIKGILIGCHEISF